MPDTRVRLITPQQNAAGYVVLDRGHFNYRAYEALGRMGRNVVVREPEEEAMPDEPKLGRIEFFPNPLPQTPPATDLLDAIRNTPPGTVGSFMPDRTEELKRERRYHLLWAAAIMCSNGYTQDQAIERAEWLLTELERREK